MELIPVIDILDNRIVHAHLGLRKSYRPLVSRLSRTSNPIDVVHGLLSFYPFRTFYIADINSILKKGNNNVIIKKIIRTFEGKKFWLDNGACYVNQAVSWIRDFNQSIVVGSESQKNLKFLSSLKKIFFNNVILSLDFDSKNKFMGPKKILKTHSIWPEKIILMTLSRVGSDKGPDLEKIRDLMKISDKNKVYAAGGIRSLRDLNILRDLNVSGSLLATALHNGNFTSRAIKDFSSK